MKNVQFSYKNYSSKKPTPKTLCRDKLSISSIGQEKPKYKLCFRNKDEWNVSFFLTTTTQNHTSIYPIYCSLNDSDLEDKTQPLKEISYIFFSNNNDIRTHISYEAYNNYIESAKFIII